MNEVERAHKKNKENKFFASSPHGTGSSTLIPNPTLIFLLPFAFDQSNR